MKKSIASYLHVSSLTIYSFPSETTYQKMLFTLSQVEFSFEKTQMVMEMNRQEMTQYKELCEEIREQINTSQKRIATYKEDFANAKEIRQHRQGKEFNYTEY